MKKQSLDHTKLDFGKYKGKTPSEISEENPSYIKWMYETVKPVKCSTALYKACVAELDDGSDDDDNPLLDTRDVWESQDMNYDPRY